MQVSQFLQTSDRNVLKPVMVLSADDRALKSLVRQKIQTLLTDENDEPEVIRYAGDDVDFATVHDELAMFSLWSEYRLLILENANRFVSENRASLEKYMENPARKGYLILDVKSFPGNTRLAKAVAKVGLHLECKSLSRSQLHKWLIDSASQFYNKNLTRDAANLMMELAGNNLGLLEQELSKLVSYVGEDTDIGVEAVRSLVGGWKSETTWIMTNALRDGQFDVALSAYQKLLIAGEDPVRILGGIAFVFRKLAKATQIASQGGSLHQALKDAGVFPRDVTSSARYLRAIGRPHAERIYAKLLETDANIKGKSRMDIRIELERLLVWLGGEIRS